MKKLKVKIVKLGELPFDFSDKRLKKFKSSIFEIDDEISELDLKDTRYSGDVGAYENDELEDQIPEPEQGVDFVLAITDCVLRDDYYARRLGDKKVIFSFRNNRRHLERAHIPLENAVFRMIYEYCIIFDRETNRIRKDLNHDFLHHETRSCLFDYDGSLEDVIFTFGQPTICVWCESKWTDKYRTPKNMIRTAKKELKGFKKPYLYKIFDWVKESPQRLVITSLLTMTVMNLLSIKLYRLISKLFNLKSRY